HGIRRVGGPVGGVASMTANQDTGAPEPVAPPEAPPRLPFFVVGVGASAGGLDAVSRLVESIPPNPGLSLLIVLHLHATSESHLPDILSRLTTLTVREAADGMPMQANHAYIIPPSTVMSMADGHIALQSRPPRAPHMPIDYLFRSLAEVQRSRAI